MKRGLRWIAAVAILLNGVEHLNVVFLDEPHEYLEEYRHIGFFMITGAFLSLWVGSRLFARPDSWAWLLGLGLSVGMAGSLILSRTVGLLDFKEEIYPQEAIRTLIYAAVYVLAFLGQMRRTPEIVTGPLRLGRGRTANLAMDPVVEK